ncbi:hypothetical protein FKO01_02455 [Mesorhizobium sp. B2-3-3]|nr:hypothetical protein FKO01_02455 [Mesorhizobium sp. B2-3-3]
MFNLFRKSKEVKEAYTALVQLFGMVGSGWERMGSGFAFQLIQSSEIMRRAQMRNDTHGPTCGFQLKAPFEEFSGWLSDEGKYGSYLRVEGDSRFAGFAAQSDMDSPRFVVSAKDGIRQKITWRSQLLKSHFVADGALDTSHL